jgi:hypothetical protein
MLLDSAHFAEEKSGRIFKHLTFAAQIRIEGRIHLDSCLGAYRVPYLFVISG